VLSVSAAVSAVSLADCAVSLPENPCSHSLFLRAFTAQSDPKPVEPVFILLTGRRLPYFSPLPPFSSSQFLFPNRRRLHIGSFIGDPFISASSIFSLDLVGISVIQTSDRGIALFHFFLLDLTRF
jgi:hypothetical protein